MRTYPTRFLCPQGGRAGCTEDREEQEAAHQGDASKCGNASKSGDSLQALIPCQGRPPSPMSWTHRKEVVLAEDPSPSSRPPNRRSQGMGMPQVRRSPNKGAMVRFFGKRQTQRPELAAAPPAIAWADSRACQVTSAAGWAATGPSGALLGRASRAVQAWNRRSWGLT